MWRSSCEHDARLAARLSFSMRDMQPLLELLAAGVPFAFAHFNDGEINSIERTAGATDRGLQQRSPALARALKAAFWRHRLARPLPRLQL